MPELPEVETVVRGLRDHLLGRTITRVQVLDARMLRAKPEPFIRALTGGKIESIRRHGKSVFLDVVFPDRKTLFNIHLGMTGQLVFEPASERPKPHTHVVFHLEGIADELRYRDIRRFGRLRILKADKVRLAPDAWDAGEDAIFAALRRKSGMAKHALMNQNVIAGLGNIYVDESLHLSRIHPKFPLERLADDRLRDLCVAIRSVLKASLDLGGTSFRNYVDTRGGRGGFKGRLAVYGKDGSPCPVCRTIILRAVVAGRGTHFCPSCQPLPRSRRRSSR